MTCPGTYPTVLNGQLYDSSNTTVEYECLAGFRMTGNKVIYCTDGEWTKKPKCTAIRLHDEIHIDFPDWWIVLFIIAGILMAMCCLVFVIYHLCCKQGHNRSCFHGCCGECCSGRPRTEGGHFVHNRHPDRRSRHREDSNFSHSTGGNSHGTLSTPRGYAWAEKATPESSYKTSPRGPQHVGNCNPQRQANVPTETRPKWMPHTRALRSQH